MRRRYKTIKKLFTILSLLALVCIGCTYKDGRTENVSVPSENVYDAEESAVIVSEELPIEDGENDIAVGPDTEQSDGEQNPLDEEIVATEEIATEEETVETVITTEENKLCVGLAKEIYEETNKERIAAGLPELVWSDELAVAADIRAEEIIDYFDHIRPDGTKCYALGDRIRGENIARGPEATGSEFVQHWMESPGHRANILREEYTLIGVGTRSVEMGCTGVQIFGY